MEHNPWKRIGTRLVYRNPWIRVREDDVIRPDGTPGIYSVMETRIATGVIALTPEREIYLVGQYRYPTEQYSWEIPEGGTEDGEDPLETAKRELQEETGVVAADWRQLGGEVHLSNCVSAERGFLYLATGLVAGVASPDGDEVLQVKTAPLAAAVEMALSGEIVDAMSIIGILRAERLLAGL